MKRGLLRVLVPLLFVSAVFVPAVIDVPPAGAVPPSISSLRTDGSTLVWIYSYYSSTLIAQTIGSSDVRTLAQNATSPDVAGDRVVWEVDSAGKSTLAGLHLSDGSPLTLPSVPGQQMKPSLSGNELVWVNENVSSSPPVWTIMTADLASNLPPQVVARLPSDMSEVGRPEISGNEIVWSLQYGGQGSADAHWELWTTAIGAAPHRVASGSGATDNLLGYDVGGTSVVYSSSGSVHLLSADSLAGNRVIGSGYNPTTDGRYAFWSAPPVQNQQNIGAFDTLTQSSFVAVSDGNVNNLPWAANGVLAWLSGMPYSGNLMVHASRISDLLPTALRPDPGTTSPNWLYFPQTGHYLAYGFKHFWEQSGGLTIFGYPMTEEFTQTGFTVQYLERQRFEYHPELAGTPYETELGLVGVEAAAGAGLLTQPAFAPLPPNTSSDANCTFIQATSHRLCFGFEQYWQSHGLDFGDRGVSFRESLALFGYPISEEFTEPSTGWTVQYFERGVFEYHPNNPEPYKVELRRLGTDRLQSFGW